MYDAYLRREPPPGEPSRQERAQASADHSDGPLVAFCRAVDAFARDFPGGDEVKWGAQAWQLGSPSALAAAPVHAEHMKPFLCMQPDQVHALPGACTNCCQGNILGNEDPCTP